MDRGVGQVGWLAVALAIGLTTPSVTAWTQEPTPPKTFQQTLAEAQDWWLFGDYERIIELLEPALFPEAPAEVSREDLIAAYELLGASQYLQYGPAAAEPALYQLLLLEPDYTLDPFLYPGSVDDYLEVLRQRHQVELDAIRAERTEPETPGTIRYIERRVEERSLLVSLLPLGIGHFANDERGWGIFYLSIEVALGSLSMGMFAANLMAQEEGPQGAFFPDPGRARTRKSIQVGSAIAFFVIVAANIVHGGAIHQDIVETSFRITDEPPDGLLEPQSGLFPAVPRRVGDGAVIHFGLRF